MGVGGGGWWGGGSGYVSFGFQGGGGSLDLNFVRRGAIQMEISAGPDTLYVCLI